MKAISLWQPWAAAIIFGIKKYETRSWQTDYRGKLLICSSKKTGELQKDSYSYIRNKYLPISTPSYENLSFGTAIATCELVDCIKMTDEFINKQAENERDCGDWKPERYAWKLENIQAAPLIKIVGRQGLFEVEEGILK
jgi:ASCH domain